MQKLLTAGASFLVVVAAAFWLGQSSSSISPVEAQVGGGGGGGRVLVQIDGIRNQEFFAVKGVEIDTEVIEFLDGNEDPITRKRPGRTKYANITLKRGVIGNDELWDWYNQVLSGVVEHKAGSIILLSEDGEEQASYKFLEAWPCKWKGFSLDAKGAVNAVEEIELAVEKIERGL